MFFSIVFFNWLYFFYCSHPIQAQADTRRQARERRLERVKRLSRGTRISQTCLKLCVQSNFALLALFIERVRARRSSPRGRCRKVETA